MEIRWLQDFLSLVECGSFTRAAELRHSSQSAFSRRIQSLEQWVGTPLVDRGAFPARLTAAGEQFRGQAADILGRMLALRHVLQGQPAPDVVRMALPYALATTSLPGWWAEWIAEEPLGAVIETGGVQDIFASLAAGTVDMIVSVSSARQPIVLEPRQFDRITLCHDRLRPYAPTPCVVHPPCANGQAGPGHRCRC